ncbi:YdbL family protein [Pedomonas mirosovicensis]|uniref:YdbL family protein n=1 Tax=Pedomonas mirosovicensis TaxID=2908641 RepID=UPI002166FC83|nr:YdbL family protein [Pedomonas mirosovicensis]MCH8684733.1 YdbL family protein [Pedomonas mirosovicensis]
MAIQSKLLAKVMGTVAALGVAVAIAGPAAAQEDTFIDQARASGQIGEQADGYVGAVKGASGDLKARIDQINIKRKAFYTQLAEKRGVTVNEVAAAAACKLFEHKVGPNEYYRTEGGQWMQRKGSAPVQLPSYCPK